MPVEIDYDNLPLFPQRIPEKLKTIRNHFKLTPDEIAPKVGAKNGAEITSYENDEDGLLVSVLWGYVRLAGCSLEDVMDDDREVTFRRKLV